MSDAAPKLTYLKDYKASSFSISETKLTFNLDPTKTIVKAQLSFKKLDAATSNLVLNGEDLKLISVKLNGRLLDAHKDYKVTKEHLTIFKAPKSFSLETEVEINPKANTTCSGLYLSSGIFCTQNEPHGFRRITYFLDRPDVLSKFTVLIRADAKLYPKLLANGNLIKQRKLASGQLEALWVDPFKKPCYLFALVAGDLGCLSSHHVTTSGRKVKLKIYATPSRIHEAKWAMRCLKRAMAWDEKQFNLEYDLDLFQIVAVDDFNFGAMENKGLNIFNSRLLLASKDSAADGDFLSIASVVGHEYFHNWTGDRVTIRDWFQIGLKEGLTTLREQLFMEDTFGDTFRIDSARFIKEVQFKEDAGPLAHPARLSAYLEINNFYTATVYEKSAEIFRMLITLTGRKGFSNILQRFLKRFDGSAATIEEFWQVAAEVVGADALKLESWYNQVGTIRLEANSKLKANKVEVILKQLPPQLHPAVKAPKPKLMLLPVAISVLDSGAKASLIKLVKQSQTMTLQGSFKTLPVISYLHDFSAPVILENKQDPRTLKTITLKAKVPVDRYLALLELVKLAFSDSSSKVMLLEVFETLLKKREISLMPWLLNLPTASSLALALNSDLLSMDQKLRKLEAFLGTKLSSKWLDLFEYTKANTKTYKSSYRVMNLRRVNALALNYLIAAKHPEATKLATNKLKSSNSLAESLGTLNSLVYWHHSLSYEALNKVAKNWLSHEALLYKWLALKGASLKADDEVAWQEVLTSKAYSWNNPNKVLALWRGFCGQNLAEFHNAKGEGYRRVTEAVLKLEAINPQIGAILAASLTSTQGLSLKAKQQLASCWKQILAHPKLSNNVREIIEKANSAVK